jgi:UDP-N-acetylmuramate dehydrogenase
MEANTAYIALTQKFKLLRDEPLKNYTSFRVGGPADLLSMPEDKDELLSIIKQASALNIPITLIGSGTNILITDKGIRGLVINTKQLKSNIKCMENEQAFIIKVKSGQRLSRVCQFAINQSLTGLEFAAGIPGTIGGAVKMNAGTQSGDMSDIVESIEVIDRKKLAFITYYKDALCFSYRNLDLKHYIVSIQLRLKKGQQDKIEETFKQNLQKKNASQPVSYASAGCFFKNPKHEKSAGELIEKSGLKGRAINDAMVSEKHANYIVNLKNASCKDILTLKALIQNKVKEKYNVELETEVRIEGE